MAVGFEERAPFLFVRADSRLFALPLCSVAETMRPLAVEPLAGSAPFMLGITLIRGVAAPVVDLATALGAARCAPPARFVAVRDDRQRLSALAVEAVVGVFTLDAGNLKEVPPLISGLPRAAIEAFGQWEGGLLTIVHGARFIPDGVWAQLAARQQLPWAD